MVRPVRPKPAASLVITKQKKNETKYIEHQKTKKINLESFVVAEETCRVRGAPPLR